MGKRHLSITYRTRRRDRPLTRLTVRPSAADRRRGWLVLDGQAIPVSLGRGGIVANKREGDGGTPLGTFHPLRLWWRGDRWPRPQTHLSIRNIGPADAWCEDPASRHYNRHIRIAPDSAADHLRRADHLYDYVIEIDHNARPRIAGRGSAVFLHLARPGFAPTAGCVGMTRGAMLRLLRRIGPKTRIVIG